MTRDPNDSFDSAFKTWAKRPPETAPEVARARVTERLRGRRQVSLLTGRRRLAVTAAVVLLVLAVGWSVLEPEADTDASAAEVELPPLEEHVLLLWLDAQTPLYLTVASPATKGGSS